MPDQTPLFGRRFIDIEKGQARPLSEPDEDKKGLRHRVLRKNWRPSKGWFIVVFLGLGACWIPAILAWTKFPEARVWGVKLLFWSVWLSILWAGWWFALVFSWIWHRVLLTFVHGFQLYKLKPYVNWLEYLHGYFALVAWALALWITWVPLIANQQVREQDPNSRSARAIGLGGRIFFALACIAAVLFLEKVSVQWIALKFHERSYRRRIQAQKEAVKAFRILFTLFGPPISGTRRDSSEKEGSCPTAPLPNSTHLPLSGDKYFDYYYRLIDRTLTSRLHTAFTDITGQIFGTSKVAEDDVVGKAFHRDNSRKMQELAKDLWHGLTDHPKNAQRAVTVQKSAIKDRLANNALEVPKNCKDVTTDDIWKVLTGGVPQLSSITEEEFLTRCSYLHAEQRRLEETMHDLQNVVGRLDDLLMLFWVVVSILVFAVALEAELKTLLLAAGSTLLSAGWLLRDTTNEVLASIIFLFYKHPFDIEDKIIINGKKYTVIEMRLLSTVFYDNDSVQVQAPNSLLNSMFIHNLRRSPATSEPFVIEVGDDTTKAQLKTFEEHMVEFLQARPKDYRDDFEVEIKELSYEAQKLILGMEIKYNNNWESDTHIRTQRRNDWIHGLRESLRKAGIRGPGTPALRVTTINASRGD